MPATRTEIGPPAACTCTDPDNGILTGPKSFAQVASLPTAIGGTISFQPGHTPKTKGIATVTSTASDGQLTTATETFATSPPTASSTAAVDAGLSKGTKAGIGAGVAAFCTGILALVAFMFVRYRRRHSKKRLAAEVAHQPPTPGPDMGQYPQAQYGSSLVKPGIPYDPSPPPHDAMFSGYSGHTGFKSELPAVPMESSKPVYIAELPAGDGTFSAGRGLNRNATPSLLSMPGSPGHLSMVSDMSRPPSVAPSMQSNQGDGYIRGPTTGNMAPIAELYG